MRLNIQFLLIILLASLESTAQKEPSENLKGIWVNGKNGIQIENGKIVLLKKEGNWNSIDSKTAIYEFLNEPLVNESNHFRTWVKNDVVNKRIINREKVDEETTQYRIFDLEIDENGKLRLTLTGLLSTNEYDKGGYWEHFLNTNKVRTKFTFKKYTP